MSAVLWAVLDMPRMRPDWRRQVERLARTDAVDVYVLRAKDAGAGEQWALAQDLRALVGPERLSVADRLDVGILAEARYLHLPGDGIPTAAARRLAPGAVLSRALHHPDEAWPPEPDYWWFGHLWTTRSKPGLPPRGLETARGVVARTTTPVIGIGGVTVERAAATRASGLSGIAVVDSLWQAGDVVEAATALRQAFMAGTNPGGEGEEDR